MKEGKFRKRPLIIKATIALEHSSVDERGQRIPVFPGDWLLTDENGKTYCLPDADFRRVYEPVDQTAIELLKSSG